MAEEEERELEKASNFHVYLDRKKADFQTKKLTQAEIAQKLEKKESSGSQEEDSNKKIFYEENPNRALEDYQVTGSVDQALQVLDASEEKHPEKRFKAAFQAFCAKRQISLRVEYPKLKRSQRQQLMRREVSLC